GRTRLGLRRGRARVARRRVRVVRRGRVRRAGLRRRRRRAGLLTLRPVAALALLLDRALLRRDRGRQRRFVSPRGPRTLTREVRLGGRGDRRIGRRRGVGGEQRRDP